MNNWMKYAGGVALGAMSVAMVQTAEAQVTTSSVRGVVTDQNGAAVAGATAVVTHTPSGTTSTATTNEVGVFSARGLRVGGPYTVAVSGDNFAPVEVTDIYVALDETYPLAIPVETRADTAVMDTIVITAAQLGVLNLDEAGATAFGQADIAKIATVDRDIADIAVLSPFANVNTQSGGAKELTIAGANNRYNSLTIDGIPLNDRFGLNANGYPTQRSPIPYDAIDQLTLQVAPMDVESNGFTGGTINAVTKSGTNEFHGSAFYEYTDDSMAGDTAGDEDFSSQVFEEKTFGFELGGPIIEDKLFFYGAYEKFESIDPIQTGPADRDVTQAQVDEIAAIAQSVYGFDAGANFSKPPVEEEKFLANLDWNINNDHRFKFTYMHNEGSLIREQNGNNFAGGSRTALGLTSAWYNRTEEVDSYVGQIFSDWTNNFSTEFKLAFTTQATGQNSLNGAEFPSIAVEVFQPGGTLNDTTNIVFGPDRFRHGNELDQEFFQLKAKGEYVTGDHTITFGYEREAVDVDNLFAQNAEGSYLFAPDRDADGNVIVDGSGDVVTTGVDNFRNGVVANLLYNNAITNNENDLRAIFGYAVDSLYIQDTWNVRDDLTLTGGLRYDMYSQTDGEIRANANFLAATGFTNTKDYDDLDGVLLPRLSFDWQPTEELKVRGGVGRFSGGSPNVWISNSFSNDGVISDSANARGPFTFPFTPDAATGQYIPQAQLDDLASTAPNGSVNALDPSFEIPTTWKVSLGGVYELTQPYVEGWQVSADVLYNKLENQPYWYRHCENVGTAPEGGRGLYNCSWPEYISVGSIDEGDSLVLAFGAYKAFDNGIDVNATYTYQDINDIGMGTSSTATSNYSDTPRLDLQAPTVGTSNFEVEHAFKLRTSYEREFFGDYTTTIAMNATVRSGQPYSYTFNENNSCVFAGPGVSGTRCARESRVDDAGHLLYVPTGTSDPLFNSALSFLRPLTAYSGDVAAQLADQQARQAAFFDMINGTELAQYKGRVAPRNGDQSDWTTIIDLRFKQELPGFRENDRTILFFDLENVGNLLNSDWGVIERTEYEYERAFASAYVENGQYVFTSFESDLEDLENQEILEGSLWQVKMGIRYEF